MENTRYIDYTLQLTPGTILFVYTDGVTEATNSTETLFGTKRMLTALRFAQTDTPEDIVSTVDTAVQTFVGSAPQFDDLTMLCIKWNG